MTVATTRRTSAEGPISEEMRRFGLRLQELRLRAGLSLEGLAEASLVSRSTIAAVEAGRQDLTTSRLLGLIGPLAAGLKERGQGEGALVFLLTGQRVSRA